MAKNQAALEVLATEHRWQRHRLAGSGLRAVNATATPLDAYGNADPPLISKGQFNIGDELRDLFERAGRSSSITASMEIISPSNDEMSDGQVQAGRRLDKIMAKLMPLHRSLVWDCLFCNIAAEMWALSAGQVPHTGVLMLRDALQSLVRKPRKVVKRG